MALLQASADELCLKLQLLYLYKSISRYMSFPLDENTNDARQNWSCLISESFDGHFLAVACGMFSTYAIIFNVILRRFFVYSSYIKG